MFGGSDWGKEGEKWGGGLRGGEGGDRLGTVHGLLTSFFFLNTGIRRNNGGGPSRELCLTMCQSVCPDSLEK